MGKSYCKSTVETDDHGYFSVGWNWIPIHCNYLWLHSGAKDITKCPCQCEKMLLLLLTVSPLAPHVEYEPAYLKTSLDLWNHMLCRSFTTKHPVSGSNMTLVFLQRENIFRLLLKICVEENKMNESKDQFLEALPIGVEHGSTEEVYDVSSPSCPLGEPITGCVWITSVACSRS